MISKKLTFTQLIESIRNVHDRMFFQASKAVNVSLTLRNWIIGFYIKEYEEKGTDRAVYGERLLEKLSEKLQSLNISSTGKRQLYSYIRFYNVYPQIVRSLPAQLKYFLPSPLLATEKKVRSLTAKTLISSEKILQQFSYTHIEQLLEINDQNKRSFYEVECIRGNWSVRELKRQIHSLYYERSGLSTNKKKLSELAQRKADNMNTTLSIRDPYVFEFLGLKPKEVMGESHLEDRLLDKIQEFMFELGNGFCFEARQKRLLIGRMYYFVDLVFYHRILKCHVLVELKLEEFSHENMGQLNTYVSWYKKNVMEKNDNPPIGILLCSGKEHALAEYALAGISNRLFISKYQLELPKIEDMQKLIEEQLLEQKCK